MKVKDFETLKDIRKQFRQEKRVVGEPIEMEITQVDKLKSLLTFHQTLQSFFEEDNIMLISHGK